MDKLSPPPLLSGGSLRARRLQGMVPGRGLQVATVAPLVIVWSLAPKPRRIGKEGDKEVKLML